MPSILLRRFGPLLFGACVALGSSLASTAGAQELRIGFLAPTTGAFSQVGKDMVDRITDDETIERAKHEPPQTTRARLRGEFIRQANLKGKDYRVDWVYLKLNDPERETILCKDPFQAHDERVERLIRSF